MKVCLSKFFLLSFSLLVLTGYTFSQTCDSKYVVNDYKGTTFIHFNKAAFTPANEVIVAGDMADYNEAGYMARFSKNGIPLWSGYYIINFYDFIKDIYFSRIRFLDFAQTPDGGVVVAGQTERYIGIQYALLAKISKYGTVEWTKTCFTNNGSGNMSFNNVIVTSAGDIIAYMSADQGPSVFYPLYSYNRVLCYSSTGAFKWGTSLESGAFDAGGNGVRYKRGLYELSDKNIVVADVVYQADKNTPALLISDSRMHFVSLDYKTGKLRWESDYKYPLPGNNAGYVPPVEAVNELPTGQLVFYTSLYLPTAADPAGIINKPVSVITDNRGQVQKLVAFHVPGKTCDLVSVSGGTAGKNDLLFNVNSRPVITAVQNGEVITRSLAYTSSYPPNCFAAGSRGYGIAESNNSLNYKLLLTDADGQAACAEANETVLSEVIIPPATTATPVKTVERIYTPSDWRDYFTDYAYPLIKKGDYPVQQTKECEQQVDCCKDFVDSVNIRLLRICEGLSYKLPDNNIVKDPGLYSVTYKTPAGCDSILYYRVNVEKNIAALTLGNDTCLTGQSAIQIRATPGFGTYNWMGTNSDQSSYTVRDTGVYWVRVSNICGTRSDSIEVFDRCEFPVYIPSAFTPNNDGLNDSFGVPLLNKNKLVRLRIYNRWGQVIFETTRTDLRWNGKIKDMDAPAGIYIYYIEMKGLSGTPVIQKGTLTLIR
ncbi:MAG: gliding motility-associated C-terminal domain-containing protein [Chitinophagaceae bacterium]